MKNKIPCEIIKDLLPSYIDKLTSEESNIVIKEHLLECESCRDVVKRMDKEDEVITEEDKKEIDFLKKSKKKHRRNIVIVIGLIALLYVNMTLFGFTLTGEEMPYNVIHNCVIDVDGTEMTISGEFLNPDWRVQDVKIEEDRGIVNVKVIKAYLLPFTKNNFSESLVRDKNTNEIPQAIQEVWVGNSIAWANGVQIDRDTSKLYSKRTPYIGESFKVSQLVDWAVIMGVKDSFGEYEIELQTESEPYGLKVIFEHGISGVVKEDIESEFKKMAAVIIGGIGNLEEVTVVYHMNGRQEAITIDKAEADKLVGGSVKECFVSVDKLQILMEQFGFLEY